MHTAWIQTDLVNHKDARIPPCSVHMTVGKSLMSGLLLLVFLFFNWGENMSCFAWREPEA